MLEHSKWYPLHRAFGQCCDWFAIAQPLAFRAPNHAREPFAVIYLPRVPAEIKFRDVAMQGGR
jgi:hypothetical protein